MEEVNVNRRYKDRLFRFLFGNEKYKKDLLGLYNALNNTDYADEEALEINVIEDVVYMKMKNDVSFLLECRLSLYEQQSTYNPNMPLRGFLYFGKLYDKWLVSRHKSLYGSRLVKIPAPQYYVFYNGEKEHGDVEHLRLSDAFDTEEKPQGFEWTATMLNINKGHNRELLEKCPALRDYAEFVDSVRSRMRQHGDLPRAVAQSVGEFKKGSGTLAQVLREHEAEVIDVCITEYDEEETMMLIKEEGREEGREEGHKEGRKKGREEGEDRLGRLIIVLSERGETDMIVKASSDSETRKKLYEKYNIT